MTGRLMMSETPAVYEGWSITNPQTNERETLAVMDVVGAVEGGIMALKAMSSRPELGLVAVSGIKRDILILKRVKAQFLASVKIEEKEGPSGHVGDHLFRKE